MKTNEDEYERIEIIILSNVNSLRADLFYLAKNMKLEGFDESKYQAPPDKRLDVVSEMEINLSMVEEFMGLFEFRKAQEFLQSDRRDPRED